MKNGCVVYSLIFAVYSSSTGIFGSRTNGWGNAGDGGAGRPCWATSEDCSTAHTVRSANPKNFFMKTSLKSERLSQIPANHE